MAKCSTKKPDVNPPKPKPEGLTHRQRFFVLEYLVDGNGTRAAKAAGYTQDDAAAAAHASRLLKNVKVKAELERHQDARAERLQIDGDQVLRELQKLADSDLRKILSKDCTVLPPDAWPDDIAPAIRSLKVQETFEGFGENREWTGYIKEITFWDKPKALELLGKNKKLFTEQHEHKHEHTLADLVAAATGASEGEQKK